MKYLSVFLLIFLSSNSFAQEPAASVLMNKLRTAGQAYKWNPILWFDEGWQVGGVSAEGNPLLYYVCGKSDKNISLILSAVHGDEITPVYWGFRMVNFLKEHPEACENKQIIVAPLVNPDGFLAKKPMRTNSRGIDLNRNFATKDFSEKAKDSWVKKSKSDKRKFPGEIAASESETLFQQTLIEKYKPSKILSVHAPLNLMDYDGPESSAEMAKTFTAEYLKSCKKLHSSVRNAARFYRFEPWGSFPGSLGNYAGKERGIPTFTLELPTIDHRKARNYFDLLKPSTLAFVNYELSNNPLAVSAQAPAAVTEEKARQN